MQAIVIFGRTSALLLAIDVLLLTDFRCVLLPKFCGKRVKVTSTFTFCEIQAYRPPPGGANTPELVEFVAGAGFEPTTQRL